MQKAYAFRPDGNSRDRQQEDLSRIRNVSSSPGIWPIEQELTYQGQIKVTVIRESRFVDFEVSDSRMKVLMIGDIMGERTTVRGSPPCRKLIANHSIDVVVGNGENVAVDSALRPDLVDDLLTSGFSHHHREHAWDRKEI